MNWNLVGKVARDRWKGTLWYVIGIEAYLLMMAAIFPSIKNIKGLDEMIKNVPKSFLRLFGTESLDITSFNNYMVGRLLGLIWVVVIAAFVISFARAMVAGEREEGTLELLLSQPIERWKVLTSEGATLFAGIVAIVVATVLGVFAFGPMFGAKITWVGYLVFIPVSCALFMAIAGYSFLISVLVKDPRRAAMGAAGVTLAFYMLHFAAGYSTIVEKIDWFGIFHYYDPLRVIDSGNLPVKSILALLAFAAVFFGVTLWLFERKDIT